MKQFPLFVCWIFAASILSATILPAQEAAPAPQTSDANGAADDSGPTQVMVVLEVYALKKDDALHILESTFSNAGRYRQTRELEQADRASLKILTALPTKSGQRAVSESVDIVRWATEFSSPKSKAESALPSSTDTRNAGDTLEMEPVIAPDYRSLDLNLVPQHVELSGFRDVSGLPDNPVVPVPSFSTQKLTTSTDFFFGEPHFVGTMTPAPDRGVANPDAATEIWLAFLKATLITIPAPRTAGPFGKAENGGSLELQYTFYSLDRKLARDVLDAGKGLDAPWQKLQVLLDEKRARFDHVTSLKTKSGQRALNEETNEIGYAAGFFGTVSGERTTRTTTAPGDTARKNEGGSDKSTKESIVVERDEPGETATIPSEIEHQNTGLTVEVGPVIGPDGSTVDLNHVITSTVYLGNLQVTGAARQQPPEPVFEMRKITTSIAAGAGLHVLTGTFNPPGEDGVNGRSDPGTTELVFVRVGPSEP